MRQHSGFSYSRHLVVQLRHRSLRKPRPHCPSTFVPIPNVAPISSSTDPSSGAKKLDPHAEKDRLQKMYETARADQQANYPDLYVSTAGANAGGPGGGSAAAGTTAGAGAGVKEAKDLAKELAEAKAEALMVQSDMVAEIEALMAKLAGKVDADIVEAGKSDAKA